MTSGWPPERPGPRRPDAPPGGSHRRSALRTPPHGIDLGEDDSGYPDGGWSGNDDPGQPGYVGSGQPGYAGAGQPGYGGPPDDGRGGRRARHGRPGQQDQGYPGRDVPSRSGRGSPPPGTAEPSYYNLAYGAHGYDAPGRGSGDGGGGPVYGAPVADVQAPNSRGYRGRPSGPPGSDAPGNTNAGSPRSRHGRPGQGGPSYAEPGAAQPPQAGPGPAGSRQAWPGEPRYAGPGPADPRYAGPGYRGPGRAGPQHDPQGYGSPRPAGPGPGRGSGPQAPASPRGPQPGHRRPARPDGDEHPPRRDGDEDAYGPRHPRPDSGDAYPPRRDGERDGYRSRRARPGEGDAQPERRGGDDAYRSRPTRPEADRDDARTSRWDTGLDALRGRRPTGRASFADDYRGRRDSAEDAYRVPAARQAGPLSEPFLAPGTSRAAYVGRDAHDLAGSPDATGPATAWMPAAADTAIGTRTDRRRAATPERGPRPGSRRAQNAGKQSCADDSTAVLPRPGRVARRSAPDEESAEPARRRGGRPGRRTGRHLTPKVWLFGGVGVLVLAVVAVALVMLGPSGPSGPEHSLTTPLRLGAFTRSSRLTRQMNVAALERKIIAQSSGQASHLVSSVYEAGSPVAGSGTPAQVMLFIGGQLSGGSPATSVKSFLQHFSGADQTGAGSLAGDAACVGADAKGTGGQTVCAWFDNNTFGELVSPNMPVSALASELRAIRPDVEHVVK
jgi:hypothetical protein